MRIAFYPSFRALDHDHSSGLVSIARNVHAAMQAEGHEVFIPLTQSMEWIYLRPWRWPRTLREAWLADKTVKSAQARLLADLPQLLPRSGHYRSGAGPPAQYSLFHPCRILCQQIPQAPHDLGRFSAEQAGAHAGGHGLCQQNPGCPEPWTYPSTRKDHLHPSGHPYPGLSARPGTARKPCAPDFSLEDKRVVVTAAMMRPGVKEDGIAFVIEACADLRQDFSRSASAHHRRRPRQGPAGGKGPASAP